MRKTKSLQRIGILSAAALVVLGLGLGIGLGVGLKNNSISSSPVNPNVPRTESFQFTTTDINDKVGNVIAASIEDRNTTYFNKLAYVKGPNENTNIYFGLTNTFEIPASNLNILDNGFDQNGHLYVPIESGGDYDKARYLLIKETTEHKDMLLDTLFLYFDAIGYFNNDNNFVTSLSGHNLDTSFEIQSVYLTFGTDESPNQVPQPLSPNSQSKDFVTSKTDDYGNVLNAQLNESDDITNYLYLKSCSPNTINFTGDFVGLDFNYNVEMLTGPQNLIKFSPNTYYGLYIPITPITVSSYKCNYVFLNVLYRNGVLTLTFLQLTMNTTFMFNPITELTNSPSTALNFATGN